MPSHTGIGTRSKKPMLKSNSYTQSRESQMVSFTERTLVQETKPHNRQSFFPHLKLYGFLQIISFTNFPQQENEYKILIEISGSLNPGTMKE